MGLRDRFERAIGLGTTDEPRVWSVAGPPRAVERPIVSTPGARVRISRDGRDGELGRVLLLCHRRGIPVELIEGPNGLWLDGAAITPSALRAFLDGVRGL